jgi:hypothetical protein
MTVHTTHDDARVVAAAEVGDKESTKNRHSGDHDGNDLCLGGLRGAAVSTAPAKRQPADDDPLCSA